MKLLGSNGKADWRETRRGFSLFEVLIIVAVLIIAAVALLPRLMAKKPSQSVICQNNLKQVGLAFRVWAYDNSGRFPMQVSVTNGGTMELLGSGGVPPHFLVLSNGLRTPKFLLCPADKNRTSPPSFAQGLANSNLSYFVGLDADATSPQTILSGDDSFSIDGSRVKPGFLPLWTNAPVAWTENRHVNRGNIALADGSVMGVSTPKLRDVLLKTHVATNRLAMP